MSSRNSHGQVMLPLSRCWVSVPPPPVHRAGCGLWCWSKHPKTAGVNMPNPGWEVQNWHTGGVNLTGSVITYRRNRFLSLWSQKLCLVPEDQLTRHKQPTLSRKLIWPTHCKSNGNSHLNETVAWVREYMYKWTMQISILIGHSSAFPYSQL